MASQSPVVLVDGSSYLFRAYHVPQLQRMTNSQGMMTGAIYGVINMIKSLMKSYPDSKVIVVFDAKGKTFRNDLYPEYKANRPPMPEELRQQIQPIHDIIRAMGLPLISIEGVEADDVIGTLAKQATDAKQDAVISTGDKDMAQLVNQHVTLINTMDKNNPITDRERVIEKFGVKPEQIIDYLALMGDKVDNIPGVEKCGPKTAAKWLNELQTLEAIMEQADAVKGKIGEHLRNALEQLPLSKDLATIRINLELEQPLSDIQMTEADQQKLTELFKEYEFKTWLREAMSQLGEDDSGAASEQASAPKVDREYHTILTKEQFASWKEKLENAELFAFDTETTSLNYMVAELVGLSFAVEAHKAAYIPLTHDYLGAPEQLDINWVLEQLKPVLESHTHKKVGQNLKYDASVLARYNIQLNGVAFDTMLESYTLNSVATRHDMNSLALKYLGVDPIHFEDIAGKGAKQVTFNQVEVEKASEYAAEDADITLQLHQQLWPQLEKEEGPKDVFQHIEMPLMQVLSKIERTGVLINDQLLREKSQQFAARMIELEQKAFDIAGEEFNLGSPKQLQRILFEKLELPVIKKTPKKQPSTAEDVLQELALDYPLPKVILEYRSLSKLKSTYTDKLPEMINHQTKRVHTSYHQAVAATGRLSSTDPNLQNIPIKSEEGRSIRQAFIAPKGYKIVAADYSQIELRIMAHLSQDEGLLNAFAHGEDVHRATAAEVFGVSTDNVSNEQRRSAKAINFGLIYGMSAFGLAKQIGVGRDEAQHYIDTYFSRYPGVEDYMNDTREKAAELGYVETLYGRRLYLPEIHSSNGMRRKAAERTAINAPMQGSAADIIKLAMLSVNEWIENEQPDCKVIMQVHDELVFEVAEDQVDACCEKIKSLMEKATEISVPLLVEAGVGDNWDEAH